MPVFFRLRWLFLLALIFLSACQSSTNSTTDRKNTAIPPTSITTLRVTTQPLTRIERSIGDIDARSAPQIAAEINGRITAIHVDSGQTVQRGAVLATLDAGDVQNNQTAALADVAKLHAQWQNQQRLTERYRELAAQQFISATQLDQHEAQLKQYGAQLEQAQAVARNSQRNVGKTRIQAPQDGRIDNRFVSVGDYVTAGKPLFSFAAQGSLKIRLPFPETAASRIHVGQRVRLNSPAAPQTTLTAAIGEIRPSVINGTRAFEAIISVASAPANWLVGGSVTGDVILGEENNAVLVPEESVVLRPVGKVVYIIENGRARQRVVETGEQQQGLLEITRGLSVGETIAKDGAGFLSDGAKVRIQTPQTQGKPA